VWRKGKGRRRITTHFWPFWAFGIAVKWPWHGCIIVCNSFDIYYVHSVEDSTLISIFDQFRFSFVFFWGCQKSALIAILKTPSGSISFNAILFLATMLRHRIIRSRTQTDFRGSACRPAGNRHRPGVRGANVNCRAWLTDDSNSCSRPRLKSTKQRSS